MHEGITLGVEVFGSVRSCEGLYGLLFLLLGNYLLQTEQLVLQLRYAVLAVVSTLRFEVELALAVLKWFLALEESGKR